MSLTNLAKGARVGVSANSPSGLHLSFGRRPLRRAAECDAHRHCGSPVTAAAWDGAAIGHYESPPRQYSAWGETPSPLLFWVESSERPSRILDVNGIGCWRPRRGKRSAPEAMRVIKCNKACLGRGTSPTLGQLRPLVPQRDKWHKSCRRREKWRIEFLAIRCPRAPGEALSADLPALPCWSFQGGNVLAGQSRRHGAPRT